MRLHHEEARTSFGPDQLSILSAWHEDAMTLLAKQDSPYASVDRDQLSVVVARALIAAAKKGVSRPDAAEQIVLRLVANEFGQSCA